VRVAVVDIGTNSTRLLVADVDASGHLTELDRRTTITRLGQGVDSSGRLSDEAIARVTAALDEYRAAIDRYDADRSVAVLTSAVRDAANGEEFAGRVRDEYGLDARAIPGSEEAQLTFLGATSERDGSGDPGPLVVIDIGGGSTEFVAGSRGNVTFFVSTPVGVVRHTERHIHSDPPQPEELEALAEDARSVIEAQVPKAVRASTRAGIAVAGTATSLAAIEQGLEPYDPSRVDGYRVTEAASRRMLARLASIGEAERRLVPGLHPDRAPTIVAGVVVLLEAMRAFGLSEVEVSEHDILHGAALRASAYHT
jgi:exopolyphosphatase / guanosine-5'-triphosphate,3'-diphosphate pyrophosphatase